MRTNDEQVKKNRANLVGPICCIDYVRRKWKMWGRRTHANDQDRDRQGTSEGERERGNENYILFTSRMSATCDHIFFFRCLSFLLFGILAPKSNPLVVNRIAFCYIFLFIIPFGHLSIHFYFSGLRFSQRHWQCTQWMHERRRSNAQHTRTGT